MRVVDMSAPVTKAASDDAWRIVKRFDGDHNEVQRAIAANEIIEAIADAEERGRVAEREAVAQWLEWQATQAKDAAFRGLLLSVSKVIATAHGERGVAAELQKHRPSLLENITLRNTMSDLRDKLTDAAGPEPVTVSAVYAWTDKDGTTHTERPDGPMRVTPAPVASPEPEPLCVDCGSGTRPDDPFGVPITRCRACAAKRDAPTLPLPVVPVDAADDAHSLCREYQQALSAYDDASESGRVWHHLTMQNDQLRAALTEVAGYVHDKATLVHRNAICICNDDGPQHCSSCGSRCRVVDELNRRVRHLLEIAGVTNV